MFCFLSRRRAIAVRAALVLFACALLTQPALADFVQQGPKLVGTGAVGASGQGQAVAISADGNTAIVGGGTDSGEAGAAWIFVRSNGVWTQQGGKLVGGSFVGRSLQGAAVAISADGNTAIVGGQNDTGNTGAAWVFVRSNGVWSAQGGKLVGIGAAGAANQGSAVALSGDGNTAIVGGYADNSNAGAVWVFTRSAGTWTQQGNKIVATGAVGIANLGNAIALSSDGNTAIVGGLADNSSAGAAWVFTRTAGTWSQVGNKLVGTGAAGAANQGFSVALSADGKTAAIGGYNDAGLLGAAWVFTFDGAAWTQQGTKLVGSGNSGVARQGSAVALSGDGNTLFSGAYFAANYVGAAWVFNRSNGAWTQLGNRLVGSAAVGGSSQGFSAALSADGSTAIVGGYGDNSSIGASWVWSRRAPHDFNADTKSDIVWRNSAGDNAMWLMNGATIASVAGLLNVPTNWSIIGQRDFNGDGKTDLLWINTAGDVAIWLMDGSTILSIASLGNVGPYWAVVGTADFNGDGNNDILWRSTAGNNLIWFMNGPTLSTIVGIGAVPTNWSVIGTADFNGDGKGDILWRNAAGDNAIWLMNGSTIASIAGLGNVPTNWSIVGTADFNSDGKSDILWRNTVGDNAIWFMNGTTIASVAGLGNVTTNWSVVSNGDYNGDGKGDILWRSTGGDNAIWFMNGATLSSLSVLGNVPTNWTIQNAAAN